MNHVKTNSQKTRERVLLAILIAITIVIAVVQQFFPRIGLSITLLPIPMGIAAVMLGPLAGAVIGFIFGLTALCQCIPVIPFFGIDLGGVELFQLNWFYTIIICIIARIAAGWLTGVIANGMKRHAPTGRKLKIREIVGMICAPLLNTVLFLSLLALLFSGVTLTIGGSSYDIIRNIVLPAISINFVIEIITCSVVGIAICAALKQYTASAKRSV